MHPTLMHSCVEDSVQWIDTDSNADRYCTQFGTDISTNKVEFNSFSL